jgi:hypothetical protein
VRRRILAKSTANDDVIVAGLCWFHFRERSSRSKARLCCLAQGPLVHLTTKWNGGKLRIRNHWDAK